MSKSDFHFYELAPGLPEFVVPQPQNDYYEGAFVPSVETLATHGITDVMRATVPHDFAVDVKYGKREPSLQYLVNNNRLLALPYQYDTISHTDVKIGIEGLKDIDPYSVEMGEWRQALYYALLDRTSSNGAVSLIDGKDTSEPIRHRTTPHRTTINSGGSIREVDGKDVPYLNIEYADLMLTRVYRWMRGPSRKSKLNPGAELPGVYNPKRFDVLMASTVRIGLVPAEELAVAGT